MVGGEKLKSCGRVDGFYGLGVGEGFAASGGVVEAVGGPGVEGDALVFWEAGEDGVGVGVGADGAGWEGERGGRGGMEEEKGEEEEHSSLFGRKELGAYILLLRI